MTSKADVIPLKQFQGPELEIIDDIIVGKDVLDLVTGAMYVDPLSIYREYAQNAADAIQEAKDAGFYSDQSTPKVSIKVDPRLRTITIRDNGIGVAQKDFIARLAAIGASRKRGTELRGFRGVGRLSGLGYCQELVYRSRARGDRKVSELIWNGKKLKELLRSDSQVDLTAAIREVAKTRLISPDGYPDHFFEVQLRSVARVQNDVLLNEEEIYSYLSQVAPVPFSPEFQFGEVIAEFVSRHTRYETIDIVIGEAKSVFRAHRNCFQVTDHVKDTFSEIVFFKIPGIEDEIDALGWLLTHSYLGAISKHAQIAGVRARVGNMQIGDANIFSNLFSQPRFNAWSVGEIHVVNKRIIPNGRRDNFEVNGHLQNLQGHIAKTAKDVVRICRDKSVIRNRLKSAATLAESAHQTISLMEGNRFALLRQHLEIHSSKLLVRLEQIMKTSLLSEEERRLVHQRFAVLADRLNATLKGNSRRKDPLAKLGTAKRRAFQDAIETVLASSLPIAIRAEITEKIIRRATQKS